VQLGDVVGIAVERSPALVIALLALMKCGAAYVPLDPAYPAERLEFMLADAGAKLLLASTPAALATTATVLAIDEALGQARSYSDQEPAALPDSQQVLYRPLPLKVLCGGEALPLELAGRLLARSQAVWNLYGPTETTIWSSAKQMNRADTEVTIGRPIANTQFYILDEHGRPTAPGTPGELCIAGDGVAIGYLNRPALTAEKFVANPFANQPGE
nr:antibiotic synthetase, putative [Tanacetum cinerariifolium]